MIILIIPIFIIIAFMDLPELIKNRYKADLIVYSVSFLFAFVLSCLFAFGVEIPSTTMWFEHIIIDVLHLGY